MSLEFCDTNVLVYAYGATGGHKWTLARELVDRLWLSRNGVLSIQVLQEFYVTITRGAVPSIAPQSARTIVDGLSLWAVVEPGVRDVLDAIDNRARWQISFWDAMILTAANKAGATALWSEDLNAGQVYGRVTVRNPFA